MTEVFITRVEDGLLYLSPSLSRGWLAPDEAAGLVLVYPSTSGGNATYDEATGLLTILAPVYADAIPVPPLVSQFTVSSPTLQPGASRLDAPSVEMRSSVPPPQITPGAVTVGPEPIRMTSRVSPVGLVDPAVEEQKRRNAKRVLIRQTLSGYFGPTEMQTVVEVCDREGKSLGKLDGITGCSFECNNNRDNTWSIGLQMRRNLDFNPVEDYVKLVFEMRLRDGRGLDTWVASPMSIYRFRNPGGEYLRSHATWSLEGESPESLILEDPLRGVYTVAAGRGVLAECRKILTDTGVPDSMIEFPMNQERFLNTAQLFDPLAEESQAVKLRVINTLLAAGGFAAIFCDKRGRYTTRRLATLQNRPPAVRYAEDGEHLMLDGVSEEKNDDRFANVIVVSSEDPEQEPPIIAIAENTDDNSPGSFQKLGYWRMKEVKMQTITSLEAAREIADYQLKAASAYYQTVGYRSKPDIERGPRERVEMEVRGHGAPDLAGTFDVQSFGGDCHPMPREMSFTASRVRDLAEGWI